MGRHRPAPHIRKRLARLAGTPDFDALVDLYMQKHYGKFYEHVCERRQQARVTVKKRMTRWADVAKTSTEQRVDLEAYAGLSEDEARYFGAKLRTQRADLQRERDRLSERLGIEALYHADDRLAADIAKQRLDQSQEVLRGIEGYGLPAETVERQREKVARLQKEYNSFRIRVDTISNTAPLFARLALAEMDAAIRLREEALEVLARTASPR